MEYGGDREGSLKGAAISYNDTLRLLYIPLRSARKEASEEGRESYRHVGPEAGIRVGMGGRVELEVLAEQDEEDRQLVHRLALG